MKMTAYSSFSISTRWKKDTASSSARQYMKMLKCDGTNILINNGKASGQEIPHLHIHVIPRYDNDGQSFGFSKKSYEGDEIKEYGKKLAL